MEHISNNVLNVIYVNSDIYYIYRVIQNKRAKIKQDIEDAPLNNLR